MIHTIVLTLISGCFFFSSCLGITLDKYESVSLEEFFRSMIENSEAGYVLYEKKPVCIVGFSEKDSFYGESKHHRQNVSLKQGVKYLNKIKSLLNNDNLIIHIYDHPDREYGNWVHILFINRNLFLKTVQDNLSLFQYVLGFEVTPQKLLDKLIDPKENFHSVLKKNEVLIGIILGFGTQNSLRGGRVENLQNKMTAAEDPPFLNPVFNHEDSFKLCKHFLIQTGSSNTKSYDLEPGFSFSCLKDDKETNILISELEETQTKIQNLLKSDQFFKIMLEKFFQENAFEIIENLIKEFLPFSNEELIQLPQLVSASIWERLCEENESYVEGFFAGMKEVNQKKIDNICFNYHTLRQLSKAEFNMQVADKYFSELDKDENLIAAYPKKVYYKCFEEGYSLELDDQINVTLHHTIKTPENIVLSDTWSRGDPVYIDLSKTISGFRWEMKGMKIGEIRDIFIHPSVGYGIYTTIEKGIYLKARVQLISVDENETKIPLDNFKPYDFSEEFAILHNSDYAKVSQKKGFAIGQKMWSHYQKGLQLSLDQIINDILLLKSDELSFDLESSLNQDLINRLHWNIYNQG